MKRGLEYTWCEQNLKAYSCLSEFHLNFLKKISLYPVSVRGRDFPLERLFKHMVDGKIDYIIPLFPT